MQIQVHMYVLRIATLAMAMILLHLKVGGMSMESQLVSQVQTSQFVELLAQRHSLAYLLAAKCRVE